jgi:acetyltransferase-like isoleucine patch superfamily enzyme
MKRFFIILFSLVMLHAQAQENIAPTASVSTSYVSPWESLASVNDGFTPASSTDRANGTYGNWPSPDSLQWIQYGWSGYYSISKAEVYWFEDGGGLLMPTTAYLEYWNGSSWVFIADVPKEKDRFNVVDISGVITDSIRVSMKNSSESIGVVEWRVYGTPAKPAKTVYIPNEWKNPAANIPWDTATRSKQSENFIVAWGPLAGTDPQNATNEAIRFNPQSVLDTLESIYKFYIHDLKVLEERGNLARYKMIITINNTWRDGLYTGWAFGSGWDNVIGGMWVDPASMRENGWVVSHEFTHTMQYMVSILYPGHGYVDVNHAGFFWETHANFMAIQRYPTFITATDLPRAMNMNNYYFGSPRKHYGDWYLLQFLKDRYGLDFVSRIWREADQPAKEHPIQTIKRLLDISQDSMNNLMAEYSMHRADWDFSNQAEIKAGESTIPREHFFRKTVLLDSISTGRFAIPDNLAPQQYGCNIVKLFPKLEAGCTTPYVYLKFAGHIDAATSAGWRYGFVSVDASGKSTYSPIYKAREVNYKFPAGAVSYYLVVTGTPDEYYVHTNQFEVGFPLLRRYPWEIRVQGMIPEGYQQDFRNTGVAGARHANGGGFVAATASVAASAYVGPFAQVLDRAQVSGTARIEGKAVVRDDARVSGAALVTDFAIVGGNAQIFDNAKINKTAFVYFGTNVRNNATVTDNATLYYNQVNDNAKIYGNAYSWGADNMGGTVEIGGDAEIGGSCTAGRYLQIPGIAATPTSSGRPQCDGLIDHPVNVDVNKPYALLPAEDVAFSLNVDCGVVTGLAKNRLPSANAGADITITLPINSVRLSGIGTDPDGEIVKSEWKKLTGPDTFSIISPASPSLLVNKLVEGVYTFSFTAWDDRNDSAADTMQVTVLKAIVEPNTPTSPTDTNVAADLEMRPNPASSTVTAWYPQTSGGSLYISDAKGRKLMTRAIGSGTSTSLSIQSLTPGVYFVRLFTADGKKYHQKLVVQR